MRCRKRPRTWRRNVGIARADQDAFAFRSQQRAAAAIAPERFAEEIVPVVDRSSARARPPSRPTSIRAPTRRSRRSPSSSRSSRPDGTVTAGNASGINDGACALLLASEAAVKEHGLTPRARVRRRRRRRRRAARHGHRTGAGDTQAARTRAGLSIAQMDVIELNEAFAAQALAVLRNLGVADDAPARQPERRGDRDRSSARGERRPAGHRPPPRSCRDRRDAMRCARCASASGRGSRGD